MSQENVETALRGLDALNRRDVQAAIQVADPEIELRPELIGTPVYRGHDGIRQWLRDVETAWESFQLEPVETRERDDEIFLAARATGRGRTTGADVEAWLFYVITFREGKVVQILGFTDGDKALEAAELAE